MRRKKPEPFSERHFVAAFGFVWIGAAAVCLTFWGVVIWAIIKIINHYT